MSRLAAKDPAEHEDAEVERLVRPSPKHKPPRTDRRREHTKEHDSDVDGDPDLKGKDTSLNYKTIGGSAKRDVIPALSKETGGTVLIAPETLKAQPGKYEELEDKESPSGKDAPGGLAQRAPKKPTKSNPPEEASSKPGSEEVAEPSEAEPKKPKSKKPKTVAQERGIASPQRREASMEEQIQSNLLLADNLPPKVAAKLIAAGVHPEDTQELVSSYKALRSRDTGPLASFAAKMSGIYQTDPDRIPPPDHWRDASGHRVSFEDLPSDEKAEAYRKHQMQVLAASLAAEDQVSKRLVSEGKVPKQYATVMASSMLGGPSNPKLAKEVFDSVLQSETVPEISEKQGRRLLDLVGDSGAKDVAVSLLAASDYRRVKKDLLESGDVSEHSPVASIAVGLEKASSYFRRRAKAYGLDNHPGSERLESRVLSRLRDIDPEKYAQVRKATDLLARRAYEKSLQAYKTSLKKWHSQPVSTRGKEPEAPKPPLGLSNAKTNTELKEEGRSLWNGLFDRQTKTASSVALHHLISSYLKGMAMTSPRPRVGLYHGIDPAQNYPAEGYTGWTQPHLRDMGPEAFREILAAARRWLKTSELSPVEGMTRSQRGRHALDLALQETSYRLDVSRYNTLLATLLGEPAPGLDQSGGRTIEAFDRGLLEKRIFAKFSPDSKMKAGGRLKVMLTGDAAEALGKDTYTTVFLGDLSDADLKTLAQTMKVKTSSYAAGQEDPSLFGPTGARNSNLYENHTGDSQMLKLSNEQRTKADQILGRLDNIANQIQAKYASWGLNMNQAKGIVQSLDKTADEIETLFYGEASLQRRQAEIAVTDPKFSLAARQQLGEKTFGKAAAVLQRDPDEIYMDTFINPMKPIQTDADEPYMSAYSDDQSEAVSDGEDMNGRDLVP